MIQRPPNQTLPLKVPLPLNSGSADLRTQVLGDVRCAESISGSVLSGVMGFGIYFNFFRSQVERYHRVISRETKTTDGLLCFSSTGQEKSGPSGGIHPDLGDIWLPLAPWLLSSPGLSILPSGGRALFSIPRRGMHPCVFLDVN